MQYNTEAIVLKSTPYGENHAIISLLTPSGRVAAMARGAKKPQSRLAAGIHLCVQGVYTIYQNSGMGNVQQFDLLNARRPLRENLEMAANAAYFCELAGAAAEERPNGSGALYRQFAAALDRLTDALNRPSDICRVWEAKVLRGLGAAPDWTRCVLCDADAATSTCYCANDGGMLCSDCAGLPRAARATCVSVPKGTGVLLQRFEAAPLERLGRIQLAESMRFALNVVLRMQLVDFAGLSLKARFVLDSLDLPG